jgi:TrpR-related protein YerC/YecD
MKKIDSKEKELFEAILKLESIEECQVFFSDLCTPAEIQSMSDRWKVVQLLIDEVPYRAIYERTGISTATVTRVARSLEYGEGYRVVLKKMKKKVKDSNE